METTPGADWTYFQTLNANRRSVRDFTGEPIPDKDMQDILEAAMLAPSSANSQPYELHWVKDPVVKALVAKACNSQRAAMTATYLVVIVASKKITRNAINRQLDYISGTDKMDERTKAYHLKNMKPCVVF
ncbi:nitroreductase family protein [Chitinophaga pinensis]|uniref:nitroreductase family protein n=1 Tax=Chitinophaga pinensis TaxID=79329 RepID=UPI00019E3AE7|nr:nitroreductase family protein [Chitinophaga pinensis]